MSSIIVNGKTLLSYALSACETMMRTYTPQNLPPAGMFYYHQGVFLSGLYETYKLTGEEILFSYLKAWVDVNVNEYGDIQEFNPGQLDYLQPGVLLFPLYERTHDARYKSAMDTILWFYEHFPKNTLGGFWHNAMGRDQMWLDGLYMAGPYLAQYAKTFDRPDLMDVVTLQAVLMERLTHDANTGLWFHAVDLQKRHAWADPKTGCSPEFWGRAMGWVPVALLNEMDFLDGKHRDTLARITRDLLMALIPYQDEATGLWYQVVDKGNQPGNWLETSCSCLYAAGLCKAIRLGVLPPTALPVAEKAVRGILNRLEFDGDDLLLKDISEGTWIGDYDFYCNRKRCVNDLHGIGAFLIMCAEAELLMNSSSDTQ
ncbi:MAG TPA: glycoside hydrolase family 88 protein [Candidatus Limiplasma sp.]|nr:glycoside hydrolase family 88 protein [Candidatus Limiplasma sp.]